MAFTYQCDFGRGATSSIRRHSIDEIRPDAPQAFDGATGVLQLNNPKLGSWVFGPVFRQSEKYFATRPWSSQIGAWASAQSSPLSSRDELEQRYEGAAAKWPEGQEVPCPPHWGGFRVLPISIEFWQGRYSRLHDRIRYERENTDSHWEINRYYP